MIRTLVSRAMPIGVAVCLFVPPAAQAQGITVSEAKPAVDQGVAVLIVAMKTHGMFGAQMAVQGCYARVPSGGLSIDLLKCLGEDTAALQFADAGYTVDHFPIPPYYAMSAFHARAMNELAQHGVTSTAAVSATMNNVMNEADAAMMRDTKPK